MTRDIGTPLPVSLVITGGVFTYNNVYTWERVPGGKQTQTQNNKDFQTAADPRLRARYKERVSLEVSLEIKRFLQSSEWPWPFLPRQKAETGNHSGPPVPFPKPHRRQPTTSHFSGPHSGQSKDSWELGSRKWGLCKSHLPPQQCRRQRTTRTLGGITTIEAAYFSQRYSSWNLAHYLWDAESPQNKLWYP